MTNSQSNSNRIAKNTLLLYVRMIFLMLVSLYTSRVILNALGVVDYGIYMAVGGFVAMFGVISNSLTAAISRFITFELGKQDENRIKEVFSASLHIQFLISGITLLLLETVGIWFLNTQMTIPSDRINAANWVFQFSILTFVINLISIPYNASIIAHEHMKAFAYIGIIQAIATLCVAFIIKVIPSNKLSCYAFLIAIIAIFIRILYGYYCKRQFVECSSFHRKCNKNIIKEIFNFAGWNFIGSTSGILRDQGVNLLINIFCGPAVNAARGIAMQVSAAVTQFSNNFLTAINPQITKSYASGDQNYLFNLVFKGARLSCYLLLLLSLPVLVETHEILQLWLKIVPEYAVPFVRLILIYVIVESISYTMITLMLATGDIKNYQILVGGFQLLNFPISFILLKLGYAPEATIVTSIVIAFICLFLRIYMLHKMVAFPIKPFLQNVLLNIIVVGIVAAIIPLMVVQFMESGLVRLFVNCLLTLISTSIIMYFIGCNHQERTFINEKIFSKLRFHA